MQGSGLGHRRATPTAYATAAGPERPVRASRPVTREDRALATPADKSLLRLQAGQAGVVFTWAGDRWEHEVVVAAGRRWRSLEGPEDAAADPRWPASPALVEVSLVAAGARPAILGVGLAGRSHFSLSVVGCDDRPDTLLFEAACRIVEPAAWLGSTYVAATGRERVAADRSGPPPATIRWTYRIGPAGLEPVGGATHAGPR